MANITTNRRTSPDNLRYIINHVFLPVKSPDKEDPDVPSKDAALLKEIAKAATLFKDSLHQRPNISINAKRAWEVVSRMIEAMQTVISTGVLAKSSVEAAMRSMHVGDVLPIYVTSQNAAIIFRKRSADELTFESFEVSLPNEVVMGTIGKVVVQYPANRRLIVPAKDELLSTLANAIWFLNMHKIKEASPSITKAKVAHENVRDTASPRYITEALAGFLRGVGPSTNSDDDDNGTTYIKKRIDDQVELDGGKGQPWRRSAMWLLARVGLQTTLEEHNMKGGEGYKAFMTFFMGYLLEQCIDFDRNIVPDDVVHAMNRKLARRLWKMKDFVDAGDSPTLKFAGAAVTKVATALNDRWEQTRKECAGTMQWTAPTQKAIQEGLTLSLQTNQKYLKAVVGRTEELAKTTKEYDDTAVARAVVSACSQRLNTSSTNLPATIDTKELEIGLMDFESWVETQLPNWSSSSQRSEHDCSAVSSIIGTYTQLALKHYAKSPERMSTFWLTVAELWVSLDRLVVKWSPLMKRYSPEIPADFLDSLLLPSASHLRRLDAIQSYLSARHTGTSLFGDISSSSSFQNFYFNQSRELQRAKVMIETWGTIEKAKTLQGLKEKNDKYESLMSEASRLSCQYYSKKTWYGDYVDVHANWCRKCSLTSDARRLDTPRFEDPLPTDPDHANALVFELDCPKPFGLWRDTTHALLLHIFSSSNDSGSTLYKLEDYVPTNEFRSPGNFRVTIASSAVSIAKSFYGSPRRLPATPGDVIFPHSGKWALCHGGNWLPKRGGRLLPPLCTFHLDKPYDTLQLFIKSTDHSPNQVIASQDKCPVSISLGEYLAFGHLRSGNQIQLLNVMRVLISDSLSLNEPAVHSLFMQTIWQAGPNNLALTWYRDAHQDMSDKKFAREMLIVLDESLKKVGDSGREVIYLATLTALATRLLSLTQEPSVRVGCLSFLHSARRMASQWMESAEKESVVLTNDDSGRQQHKMALIAVALRLTFDVDDGVLANLCQYSANIDILLFTQMMIAADSTQPSSLPEGLQLLLRRNRHLTYRLHPYLASALRGTCKPLHEATRRIWKGYERGSPWTPLGPPGERWWKCQTASTGALSSLTVYVNLLSGEMLVNGKTPERLPPNYVAHDTYQSLFDKSVSLRSHPSSMSGMEYEVTYYGLQIHFAMIGGSLIVRALRDGAVDAVEEYIPGSRLQGDVSASFFREQRHWYIEKEGIIEFRPLISQWNSNVRTNWTLRLATVDSCLRGTLQKKSSLGVRVAMDPHSAAFKLLHDGVKGVEPHHLGMTAEAITSSHNTRLNISLPDRSIDFFLNDENHLESRSFPDYILDSNRDIGCLYGLVNLIVLCDNSLSQRARKVVIPRGRIETLKFTREHPTVQVNVSDRGGFHVYEVDTLVGRLLGNGTMESDLFLIQMHAFTSSHCPDPLTGRTGTEQALESLQSASLLSHHVPSSAIRTQMEQIAGISPRREYYPHWAKVMQRTTWNANLPLASQHPAFEMYISDILSYWSGMDLQKVHLEHAKPLRSPTGMAELSSRAALRDLRSIPSHSALQSHHQADFKHTCRDAMETLVSLGRELLAYQFAYCTHHLAAGLPVCNSLKNAAENWDEVQPCQPWGWTDIAKWFNGSTPSLWSTLYKLCCNLSRDPSSPRFNTSMTLSMLAYGGQVPLPILGSLAAIARDSAFQRPELAHSFQSPLKIPCGSNFDESEIQNLVMSISITFDDSQEARLENAPGANHHERLRLAKERYESALSDEVDDVVAEVKSRWPDTLRDRSAIAMAYTPHLQDLKALLRDSIRPLMDKWMHNRLFLNHLLLVDRRIQQLPNSADSFVRYLPQHPMMSRSHATIVDIQIEGLMNARHAEPEDICALTTQPPGLTRRQPVSIRDSRTQKLRSLIGSLASVSQGKVEERYKEDLEQSLKALSESPLTSEAEIPPTSVLEAFHHNQKLHHSIVHSQIINALLPTLPAQKLLGEAGLWPRLSSQVLLSRLSLEKRGRTTTKWLALISLYANQIIAVQRSRRLLHYGTRAMAAEYNREVLHSRQRELSDHPDWLLVEIDSDICIRLDQKDIANAMISPNGSQNTVMQLNMGEGKSSVIVPIVAATLANAKQLVRVVVLKPQSKLQLNLLRGRLSKLANRRVIYLPFSRDWKVDLQTAGNISRILEKCRADGGVWLCQPEHLLSFKLLGLDLAMRTVERSSVGAELIRCQLWMQANTRDILDESDEILHTRHQLVYTVGGQTSFDGSPMRWEVVEQLLSLLQSKLAPGHLPFSGQFSQLRIDSDQGNGLFHGIAEEIVFKAAIPSIRISNLPDKLKKAAFRLLNQHDVSKKDPGILELQRFCQDTEETLLWQSLLLVRGLLAFNILPLAILNKRWRVDYGHDLRRSQLAVPYRAKDSPSLRSDFAHPDVLIVLTCLTYYYSGLSDSMIIRTVKELHRLDNPELTYEQWISPYREAVPPALHKLAGVNLEDDKMIVRSLGPFIRYNKVVIDFFLNRCVFPKDAREFPFKMSTSGWDLAMTKGNPTTGFSGTNDSRFLLPTSIIQGDSSAQRHTNATVLAHILGEENSTVVCHGNNLTSTQILDTIFDLKPRPSVLLDVGAQILDLSNAELVKFWLSKYDDNGGIKAAVFFDDDDNMCMMERDGSVQSFADSPFSSRPNECLVYLDDAHTRGTDLKLPACRAAVTLGPRLPKDKLVQGCMRMRKLGSQHSLVFLAPEEVVAEVRKLVGDEEATVQTSHVLQWTMKETCRQLQLNVSNWAVQGREFAARQVAWSQISGESKSAQDMVELFCQEESRSLSRLYGIGDEKKPPPGRASSGLGDSTILRAIKERCQMFEPFSMQDAQIQEEQEVELIHEHEVEREVYRPPSAKPALHSVHNDVREFVRSGRLNLYSMAFRSVQRSFEHSSLVLPAGGGMAFSDLMVTNDFYHTIEHTGATSVSKFDDFLRSVEWLVSGQTQDTLVAFSPFEVNALLSLFRVSKHVKLHLFSPRTSISMRSLEDLQLFTIPTNLTTTPLSSPFARQLNLYSGTLYLRDFETYEGVCAALRLHFGEIEDPEIADMGVINSNGFVKDAGVRSTIGLVGKGFDEDPVQFFRRLFHLRRNGRSFLPSHMGQILFGVGLTKASFNG